MKRAWIAVSALTLTLVAGCGSGAAPTGGSGAGAPAPVADVSSVPAQPVPPAASTAAPTTAPAATTKAPAKLKSGSKGSEVLALQKRLTELGYWNGKADGKFGGGTQQAVYALQKAAGISRDGTVGPKTKKALTAGVRPKAKSKSGYVVEIDKKRQLLMLVRGGKVEMIFNTSTGSGKRYEQGGSTHIASTPSGKFTVTRQIDGMRHAPLGELWRPKYFNGGIAVHGSNSVPPYAASHGCARLTNAAINYIWDAKKIPLKTKVWVY